MIIQAILNGYKINVQCEEFHVLFYYVLFISYFISNVIVLSLPLFFIIFFFRNNLVVELAGLR